MVDPTVIATGLGTLDTYIDGPFQTITTDVTSDLTAYAVSSCIPDIFDSQAHPSIVQKIQPAGTSEDHQAAYTCQVASFVLENKTSSAVLCWTAGS